MARSKDPRAKDAVRELRHVGTDAERALWTRLRDRRLLGYKFRRQHPVAGHVADFACIEANLIVELDGGQHFCAEGEAADDRRTAAMNTHGFHVMRFTNREALLETEAVLTAILHWLEQRRA